MKYFLFLIFAGFLTSSVLDSNVFADSDPNDDYVKFNHGDSYIYADNKQIIDISLDWNDESLPHGIITFDQKVDSEINIMIPKNIPRTMNLDFGSSLAVFYSNTLIEPVKETETDCFYHLRINVNDVDEIKFDSISVAAGRWESVTVNDLKCDTVYKHYSNTYKSKLQTQQVSHNFPEPEPEQDISVSKNCGPGTTYAEGICVLNKTEKTNPDNSICWGGTACNYIQPPLKQIKSGIKFHNVECKNGLELVYKKADDTSACVAQTTEIELVIRGWAEDNRILLGCTGERLSKCYPDDPQEYRRVLYKYYFGPEEGLPSSGAFDFKVIHTTNACTDKPLICYGEFENGTKIRVSCDYHLHGCGTKSISDHKTINQPIQWKKYITIEASRIDGSRITEMLEISQLDQIPNNSFLTKLFDGADACQNETELCALPKGVTFEKTNPLKIPVNDSDMFSVTLDETQANSLLSQLNWVVDGNWTYTVIKWQENYYLLVLSTFDNLKTPDVKMKIHDALPNPVVLERGNTLRYSILVETWATYGAPATVDLVAVQDARDSGVDVWVEPPTLIIPERSKASSTLYVHAAENAPSGIYDVRVIGTANGRLADLYCRNTTCPTVKIGNSDWSISTFGSNGGRGIGGGNSPENTWLELELNKNVLYAGEIAEIKAFLVNNGTEKLTFTPNELLISVIKAEPVGYYENLYGIDARYESEKTITIEAKSKTPLVRPFYWNQTTFQNFDEEQRLESKQYKMIAKFVGDNNSWNDDLWFEIK